MNYRKALMLVSVGAALFSPRSTQPNARSASTPGMEPYDDIELPPDFQDKSEWVFARLMYPQHPRARFGGYRRFGGGDWREGGTSWTQDYPRADRHFAQALRRLSRVNRAISRAARQSRRWR